MKWYAQALHVARKDMMHARWLLYAYLVLTAFAALAVTEWWLFAGLNGPFWSLALMMIGVLLVATVIQGDSPARTDAFWVTRPLRASAVLGGKLLILAGVVLMPALLAQLFALQVHDTRATDVVPLLWSAAVSYGMWLGFGAVLAALTRDVRGFITALVLVIAGWGVLGALLSIVEFSPVPETPTARWSSDYRSAITLIATLAIVAYLYHSRNVRMGVLLAILLSVGSSALSSGSTSSSSFAFTGTEPERSQPDSTSGAAALADFRVIVDTVLVFPGQADGNTHAGITLRALNASPAHRYILTSAEVYLARPGERRELLTPLRQDIALVMPQPPDVQGYRWTGADHAAEHPVRMNVRLAPQHVNAVVSGKATFQVTGYVTVHEARTLARLPLESGAASARDGVRVRLDQVTSDTNGTFIHLQWSTVSQSVNHLYRRLRPEFGDLAYTAVLANAARSETVLLRSTVNSGHSFGMPLPTADAWSQATTLRPVGNEPLAIGPEWLTDAQLLVVHWAPAGGKPVRVDVPWPDAPR